MKKAFKSSARVLYIDFTHNLIRNQVGNQRFKVALFTGVNHLRRIQVYGLGISINEQKETIYGLLKSFFDIMDKQV